VFCLNNGVVLGPTSTNVNSLGVTVLSVGINDSLETLQKFMTQHPLSYPVLLRGTFDDSFARRYNVHLVPTNLVIAPYGEVGFVGRGYLSLEGAVRTIARGQHLQRMMPYPILVGTYKGQLDAIELHCPRNSSFIAAGKYPEDGMGASHETIVAISISSCLFTNKRRP
jgi:hypothetical protein